MAHTTRQVGDDLGQAPGDPFFLKNIIGTRPQMGVGGVKAMLSRVPRGWRRACFT